MYYWPSHYYRPYPYYTPWYVPQPSGRCPTCGKCLTCGSGGHYCAGPRPYISPRWGTSVAVDNSVTSKVDSSNTVK